VPLETLTTKVRRARGASLEAAARDARYALLAGALAAGEFLLTAHHEDDQLETVLLQLFRGAGLAGLAAMPQIAPFASGWLVRPLLSRSRRELEAWVIDQGLGWVEDGSNTDEQLSRNYLRRQVLPLIRERWAGVGSAVARSARHAAEAQRLLDRLALGDIERAANGSSLSVQTLRSLPPDRRRNALRFWISQAGVKVPDTRRLEELAGPVMEARLDANPFVQWDEVVVQRHADLLSIRTVATPVDGPAVIAWSWSTCPKLEFADGRGTLELLQDPHGPVDLGALPDTLLIRRRIGGERLRPKRGGPRRALKSLLQEAHLPITERTHLPLLYSGNTLLAAGGLWVDESIQAAPGAGWRGRFFWRR
jgi:tRNA(Ile)-lysidine synthase